MRVIGCCLDVPSILFSALEGKKRPLITRFLFIEQNLWSCWDPCWYWKFFRTGCLSLVPFPSLPHQAHLMCDWNLVHICCDNCREKKSQWVSERKTPLCVVMWLSWQWSQEHWAQNKNKWAGYNGSTTQTSSGSPRLYTALLPEALWKVTP